MKLPRLSCDIDSDAYESDFVCSANTMIALCETRINQLVPPKNVDHFGVDLIQLECSMNSILNSPVHIREKLMAILKYASIYEFLSATRVSSFTKFSYFPTCQELDLVRQSNIESKSPQLSL